MKVKSCARECRKVLENPSRSFQIIVFKRIIFLMIIKDSIRISIHHSLIKLMVFFCKENVLFFRTIFEKSMKFKTCNLWTWLFFVILIDWVWLLSLSYFLCHVRLFQYDLPCIFLRRIFTLLSSSTRVGAHLNNLYITLNLYNQHKF